MTIQIGAGGVESGLGGASPAYLASSIVSGRKVITTAGTAEALVATATPCVLVLVSADLGNTAGPMVVGGSGVVAADTAQEGTVIVPGNAPQAFVVNDVSLLYADAQTGGDAVCFTYFVK